MAEFDFGDLLSSVRQHNDEKSERVREWQSAVSEFSERNEKSILAALRRLIPVLKEAGFGYGGDWFCHHETVAEVGFPNERNGKYVWDGLCMKQWFLCRPGSSKGAHVVDVVFGPNSKIVRVLNGKDSEVRYYNLLEMDAPSLEVSAENYSEEWLYDSLAKMMKYRLHL